MNHEKACGTVIAHQGQVLLIHQHNGLWGFPKGHTEPGETELETAFRETFEETGLRVTIDPTKRYEFSYHISDLNIQKTVVLFVASLDSPRSSSAPQASEIAELIWAPYSEVKQYLNFPEWQQAWQAILPLLPSAPPSQIS